MIENGISILIKSNKITKGNFEQYLNEKPDGWYLLEIKRPPSDITLQQHRYYRSIVLQTIQGAIHDAGQGMWPVDEIHDEMKKRYGIRKYILGGKSEVIKSMSNYSKSDYSEYLEKLRSWLYDRFEIILPEPHEYNLEND